MKLKKLGMIFALIGFSASIFAEPVTYSFSGFGGGLPSSASVYKPNKLSTTTTQIIIDDDSYDDYEDYDDYESQDSSSNKKRNNKANNNANSLVSTFIIGGIIIATGILVGSAYLSGESAECCQVGTEEFFNGCFEGMSEECGEMIGEACAEAIVDSCSSTSLSALFGNGLRILPIYVP